MKAARKLLCLALAAVSLCLGACGSLFDREYLSVTEYEIPPAEQSAEDSGVTIRNEAELRQFLVQLLDDQAEEGHVTFDAAYEGDISADISNVCWKVRTQDALYAYCVSNISYELNTGLEEQLQGAIRRGDERLVVLIGRSMLSAEDVETMAGQVYRDDPILEPREPRVQVNMLSGTGQQRLYEINFSYGMNREELAARRAELQALEPFSNLERLPYSGALRALMACNYLTQNCRYREDGESDIYAALALGEADSEGLALAYIELCRQLDVPCQIVYGQRDWESRCWNIIRLGEDYYHVDISVCSVSGPEMGFLLPDETMWAHCRWDISSYPPCAGKLRFRDLLPKPIRNSGGKIEEVM